MLRHMRAPRQTIRLTPARPVGATALAVAAALCMPALAMAQGTMAPGSPAATTTQPASVAAAQVPIAPGSTANTTPADPSGDDMMTADGLQAKVGKEKAAQIETHVARLHSTLRITPAQEPLWRNFASVMRQNVVQMDAVAAKRQGGYGTMNAVQDLVSYGELEQTNARNVQQLLPPFQALYESFSPEQKKAADATFLRYTDKAVRKRG